MRYIVAIAIAIAVTSPASAQTPPSPGVALDQFVKDQQDANARQQAAIAALTDAVTKLLQAPPAPPVTPLPVPAMPPTGPQVLLAGVPMGAQLWQGSDTYAVSTSCKWFKWDGSSWAGPVAAPVAGWP